MDPIRLFTSPDLRGGSFRIGRRPGRHALLDQATTAGWRANGLDGHATGSKSELLAEIARLLDFPDWFGNNWDALVDCLRTSTAKAVADGGRGRCLIWDHADVLAAADPESCVTFGSICDELAADGFRLLLLARSATPLEGFRAG